MSALIQFSLPLPPGVNNQYVTVNGRRTLSRSARTWKRQAGQVLTRLDIPAPFRAILDQSGLLAVFIDCYFETPFRRDLDGGLKITLDTVCGALGVDDRRVVDIHLVKRIDPLNPRIDLELEAISDWQFEHDRAVLQ